MLQGPSPYSVLCICGVDPLGFSGLATDLNILARHGVPTSIAITALTLQTGSSVLKTGVRSPTEVARDIRTILAHRPPAAIKIGMLGSGPVASAVAKTLRNAAGKVPIVLDPVLNASSGGYLSSRNLLEAIHTRLLPIATVITPNIPEAEVLIGGRIRSVRDMTEAALALVKMGAASVYLKGGHLLRAPITDVFATPERIQLLGGEEFLDMKGRRIDLRGTGCALSSALAAQLALGFTLSKAAIRARRLIADLIREERLRRRA